jgi:hypothetical protein
MSNKLSRRDLLGAGAVIGGTVFGGSLLTAASGVAQETQFPFPTAKIKAKKAAQLGYDMYNAGKGCCYAAFWGVLGNLVDKGEPYSTFPAEMMTVGGGGMAGWGSLCGTLIGGAMAISLFAEGAVRTQMIDILYTYYESEKLPDWTPKTPMRNVSFSRTVADSVLCHVSVSKTGLEPGSDEQKERCARLAASVSATTAALITALHKNKTLNGDILGKVAAYCKGCHGAGISDAEISKMSCTTCHEDHTGEY